MKFVKNVKSKMARKAVELQQRQAIEQFACMIDDLKDVRKSIVEKKANMDDVDLLDGVMAKLRETVSVLNDSVEKLK